MTAPTSFTTLEELRQDKARLDWLDRNRGIYNISNDSKRWHLSIRGVPGTASRQQITLRDAIDIAIRESAWVRSE